MIIVELLEPRRGRFVSTIRSLFPESAVSSLRGADLGDRARCCCCLWFDILTLRVADKKRAPSHVGVATLRPFARQRPRALFFTSQN